MKLSEAVKNKDQLFLYGEEVVNAQYVFKMIWNGETVTNLTIPKDITVLHRGMENAVKQLSEDAANGTEKEWYDLGIIPVYEIEVDIAKDSIKPISEYEFEYTE